MSNSDDQKILMKNKKSLQTLQSDNSFVMDKRLSVFLSQFIINSNFGDVDKNKDNITHVSEIDPKRSYCIDRKNYEIFWDKYQDLVYNDSNIVVGIGEKPSSECPILADIDLRQDLKWLKKRYNIDKSDKEKLKCLPHLYDEDDVMKTMKIYQDTIKEIVVDCKEENLICVLLEKKYAYVKDDGRVASGFHLHFPDTFLKNINIEIHLIPRVKEKMKNQKIFSKFDIEKPEETVDKGITSKYWLMKGSKKEQGKESYQISGVYNSKREKISLTEAFSKYKLYTLDDELIEFKKPIQYYLPRILSIKSNNRNVMNVKADLEVIDKTLIKKYKDPSKKNIDLTIDEYYKQAKELMEMISSKRANDYDSWLNLGFCLFNIGEGTKEFFEIWNNFSSKTTRIGVYSETETMYRWSKMVKSSYSIGTLHHFAKEDSPASYEIYKKKRSAKYANLCVKGSHNDLAVMLFDMYGEDYVCASIDKNIWFMYDGHKWNKNPNGHNLREKISSTLKGKFLQLRRDYHTKINNLDAEQDEENDGDNDERKGHLDKIKKLDKIIQNLSTAPYKDNVMKECKEVFYREKFMSNLNTNPYLLGFDNGILDVKTFTLRPGKQDDEVSFSCGYDYKEYTNDSEEVKILDSLLEKIYVDKELRQFFLDYCSSLLRAGNYQKWFLIISGIGHNGKSVLIELIFKAFGKKYAIKFPTSMITGKRTQSSACSPELMRSAGARFAVFQEPGGKDTLNVGVIKEITGNDSIIGRDLYVSGDEMAEILPLFKCACICNNHPNAPDADPAFWDRVRVLTHESRFLPLALCPKTPEEQLEKKIFPADNTLADILDSLKGAFMWKIVQNAKKLKEHGPNPEPLKVLKATSTYKNNNNVFLQFINDSLVSDESNVMQLTEIFILFKEWFKTNVPGQGIPTKTDLQKDLILRWGELKNSKIVAWKGWRSKTKKDDDKENIIIEFEDESLDEKKIEEKLKEKKKDKVKKETNIESYKKQMNGEYCDDITDIDDVEPKRLLRGVKRLLKRRIPVGRSPRSKKESGKKNEKKWENEQINNDKNITISEAPL